MALRREGRDVGVWALAGLLGAVALAWAFPRAYPFLPGRWELSKSEAREIALERFRDLGEPVASAYLVTHLESHPSIERRLQHAAAAGGELETLRRSPLGDQVQHWQVVVYPPGVSPEEWTYRAGITLDGRIFRLRLRVPPETPGDAVDPAAARAAADRFLAEHGVDLATLEEPEVRTQQVRNRTDTTLRYRYREQLLGPEAKYGVEVSFAGETLAGFAPYSEYPDEKAINAEIQPIVFLNIVRYIVVFLLVLVVVVPFVRRYHAGEIGVKRGVQLFVLVFALAILLLVLPGRASTEGFYFGVLTRAQTTFVWIAQMLLLFFLPFAFLVMLVWSVGESFCRERWGHKLAAFDAILQKQWGNATVARSALRGTAAGLALAGLLVVVAAALRPRAWSMASLLLGPWWPSATWSAVALLAFALAFGLYSELFGRLFLLPLAVGRLGTWGGAAAVAVVSGLVFWTAVPVNLMPVWLDLAASVVAAAIMVALFLRYDLLTNVVAYLVGCTAVAAFPFATAEDPWLQFQGWLALLGAFLPFLLSVRHLASEREFVYRYDDVPPHVRRIAERERQRVELETARNIQSSILPDLPPQLAGVEIAHTYLPATEVGGDFYDVLALEDGRLAVAVGDVAGHGVSSGLVMSMAKSALAVQVTFDPDVEAVFTTLNRMVFQTARRRLLATLCYALIDPKRREMFYASAGHLFPYRVSTDGRIDALESISYPLGVRGLLEVQPRTARLEAGDTLVLFSDGVVEARREEDDEVFGFERLEASLARHAGKAPQQLRDGVLADVRDFSGDVAREDDLTLLVLRLPAA